jgi:(2Fe-2S) ferredoxin
VRRGLLAGAPELVVAKGRKTIYQGGMMNKPTKHILVCGSFRRGTQQGICHKKESTRLLQYFEQEISDRGMDEVMVSSTGCLQACDEGPVVVVYPQNVWYGKVDEQVAEAILDALEGNSVAEAFVIA